MGGIEGDPGLGEVREVDALSAALVDQWVGSEDGAAGGGRRPGFMTALERTQRAAVIPYGYTLCVWSGSALLIDGGHHPGVAGILGYTLGAVAGFALPKLGATRYAGSGVGGGVGLHVAPILTVVASIALIGRALRDPWVWAVSGAVVTSVYFLSVAAQSWIVARARGAVGTDGCGARKEPDFRRTVPIDGPAV